MDTLPTMTVRQLIEHLSECVDWNREVEIWLPGSRIKLAGLFLHTKRSKDAVQIEGNVTEGSILADIVMRG